jgi:hypothetical protein
MKKHNKHKSITYSMFVKEHNSNHYVFVKYDDYACKRNFYDELIRIQYHKVHTYPNELEHLERILEKSAKQLRQKRS